MAAPLRVVVVGEDPLARSALLSLLDGREDLLVAGQGTPEEALALLRSTGADLVLWDLGVDLAPDIEALREATDAGAAPVLVLAPEHARVPDLLGAGVAGVLGRDADALRLAAALHAAAEDLLVVERALSDGALRTRPAAEALVEPLGRTRVISGFLAEDELNGNGQDAVERRIANQSIVPCPADGLAYPGGLEPGMIICIESYIGSAAAAEGVKLEEQLLITPNGAERLSQYRYDDRLMTPMA